MESSWSLNYPRKSSWPTTAPDRAVWSCHSIVTLYLLIFFSRRVYLQHVHSHTIFFYTCTYWKRYRHVSVPVYFYRKHRTSSFPLENLLVHLAKKILWVNYSSILSFFYREFYHFKYYLIWLFFLIFFMFVSCWESRSNKGRTGTIITYLFQYVHV